MSEQFWRQQQFVRLTRGASEADGAALAVGDHVGLGAEPATRMRAAKRLTAIALLAVAPFCGPGGFVVRADGRAIQERHAQPEAALFRRLQQPFPPPCLAQRRKVCAARHQGQVLAGIARHFAPFWCRQMIASMVRRRSCGGVLPLGGQASVERRAAWWQLVDDDGTELGAWDAVVVATPAPEAVPLLAAAPAFAERAAQVAMDPCWAVRVGLDAPVDQDFTIARPEDGPLAWVARNSSKPARRGDEAWVLHARHDWSVAHLEEAWEDIARRLLGALAARLERSSLPVAHLSAHVGATPWRRSQSVSRACLIVLSASALAATGAWAAGSRPRSYPAGRPRRAPSRR